MIFIKWELYVGKFDTSRSTFRHMRLSVCCQVSTRRTALTTYSSTVLWSLVLRMIRRQKKRKVTLLRLVPYLLKVWRDMVKEILDEETGLTVLRVAAVRGHIRLANMLQRSSGFLFSKTWHDMTRQEIKAGQSWIWQPFMETTMSSKYWNSHAGNKLLQINLVHLNQWRFLLQSMKLYTIRTGKARSHVMSFELMYLPRRSDS